MADLKTWQQCRDYTFKTRDAWRNGNGAKTMRINCEHFTRLRGSSFPVTKITQPILHQVCVELEEEGMADATINRVISAVSTVLNHCAFDGKIDQPAKFRRRKENEARMFWFTKEEVERMVCLSTGVYERPELADIIQFAAYTGMRQSEILRIRAKDIDFHGNRIHVGGVHSQNTKTGNWRVIPIHESLVKILQKRISQSSRSDAQLFGGDWTGKHQLLRAFKKVVRLLGKDDVYVFHCLRHSYGTWLVDSGVPLRHVMALMGHKNIETTLRYAKATDEGLTRAMESI